MRILYVFYFLLVLLFQEAYLQAQTPPVPAVEHGLTHCGFHEDFKNYGGIDIHNTGKEGYNFYVQVPWSSTRAADTSDFTVENDILTLEFEDADGPKHLWSVFKLSNTEFNGWYHNMATQGPVYFEAKIRWDYSEVDPDVKGHPAFWSNPVEFVDHRTDAPYHHFTELDFMEFDPKWCHGCHDSYLQNIWPTQREPGGF